MKERIDIIVIFHDAVRAEAVSPLSGETLCAYAETRELAVQRIRARLYDESLVYGWTLSRPVEVAIEGEDES